jgi:protein-S-isoprenylcysteine O-methyltransferase Ste14
VTPRYWFPKPYADRVARMLVPSGFLLVAAFAWFSHPVLNSLLAGTPVSIAGLLLRAWSAGHLAKNQQLAQFGPYAFTRNPLYLGTLLVAGGLVVAGQSALLAIIFALVFLLVYLPVIELEEQHLRNLFPDYEAYAQRVPKLLGWRKRAVSGTSFEIAQYRKNREYEALAGYLAGLALLIGKYLWSR